MPHTLKFPPEKFGALLGYAPGGVAIYSSHYPSADIREYPDRDSYHSYLDGIYMGYKWQCVEFARRWLYLNHGYVFDDVAMAYDIFYLHNVIRLQDNELLPLHSFLNGSRRPPEPGCMLIWQEGGEFEVTGHVAIVTEVLEESIRFAEQNIEHSVLPENQDWSRELKLSRGEDGGYTVHAAYEDSHILGWVIQTMDSTHAEPPRSRQPALFNLNTHLAPLQGQHEKEWLDPGNKAEAAYVKALNGHRLTESGDVIEQYRYFRMSETAETELKRATNELHLMFLHATQAVLRDDALLSRFNIPRALWPRLKTSWENRRGQMITGRFDFSFSDRGLKVYEYNADSASCHTEAGRVQGKWATHFGVTGGEDAGDGIFDALKAAWASIGVDGILHIMQDNEAEESYHAQFMRETASAAGISSKVIKGVENLGWSDDGEIIDPDGVPIRFVWKTWAWETALDQIREECEEDDCFPVLRTGSDANRSPRLVDVLLRPTIRVFEPFWTLIPSNKAILPILWEIFPDHPYLLNSQFVLTDSLARLGYASKPIVGRCGSNITLFDKNDNVLKETQGQFDNQDHVYQELCKLPEVDGYRVQVCTFTALGKFAGSCVRVDKSLVITQNSDVLPLRVVEDDKLAVVGAGHARDFAALGRSNGKAHAKR
jgi:glutathionylspermidine amidase/synthetase